MKTIISLSALLLAYSAFAIPFPDLPWTNHEPEESTYRNSDYPTAITVVETYFLGCHYCNENAANVNALATEFKNEPRLQVLDVGIDRHPSQYKTWISRHKPNHPVLNDANRRLIKHLGTATYPSTYVLDCNKNIIASTVGVWNEAIRLHIRNAITNGLAKKCHETDHFNLN